MPGKSIDKNDIYQDDFILRKRMLLTSEIGQSLYCIFEGETVLDITILFYCVFYTILYYDGEPCLVTINSWNRMTLGYTMHLIK